MLQRLVWSEHRAWHWMALAGGNMSAVTDPRRQFAPSAERNKEPILQVLKQHLPSTPKKGAVVLEVASGTGQHTAHFATHLPAFTWQVRADSLYRPEPCDPLVSVVAVWDTLRLGRNPKPRGRSFRNDTALLAGARAGVCKRGGGWVMSALAKTRSCDSGGRVALSEPAGMRLEVARQTLRTPKTPPPPQPTEYAGCPGPTAPPQLLNTIMESLVAYTEELPNVLPPLALDASSATWREDSIGPTAADDFVGVLAVNVLHISPFAVTEVRVPCLCRTSCRRRCIRWWWFELVRDVPFCVWSLYTSGCVLSARHRRACGALNGAQASKTDVTILSWPHAASSAPWSATPSLQCFISWAARPAVADTNVTPGATAAA